MTDDKIEQFDVMRVELMIMMRVFKKYRNIILGLKGASEKDKRMLLRKLSSLSKIAGDISAYFDDYIDF